MHSPCARSGNRIAAKEQASIPELNPAGYERAVFGATTAPPRRRTDITVTHSAVLAAFVDARQAPLRISQGEQAEFDHTTGQSALRPSDVLTAPAWRRGQLVVDNAPLAFVVEELNRNFAGRIVIVGRELSQRGVSGTLSVSDTQASLDYLEQALRLKVNKPGPLVVVR